MPAPERRQAAALPVRWGLLAALFTLLVGGAVVLAMAFLWREQSAQIDSSRGQLRDFRSARLALTSGVLDLTWAAGNAQAMSERDRADLQNALAQLNQSLAGADAAEAADAAAARQQLAEVGRVLQHDARPTPEEVRRLMAGFQPLDQSLERLYQSRFAQITARLARQQERFDLAVAVVLLSLVVVAGLVWSVHRRLGRTEEALQASEVQQRQIQDLLEERSQAQLDLQQGNAQLRDAEAFVRLVADIVPDRIAYWDRDIRCRFVNHACARWYGRAGEDLIGRSMEEVIGADWLQKTSRPHFEAALAGEPQEFEREEYSASGEFAVVRITAVPDLRDGVVHGVVVLATDITAHRQAAELLRLSNTQLELARDRADEASRAKSAFLANMSHEIRTPMNAIIGLTHMLRREGGDAQQQQRLAKIWDAAHHLQQVINDILDVSKIEAGKMVLEAEDFSLDALLTRTCSMVLEAARDKGLELVVDTEALPDRLNGDPTRLMQALLNLLSNAVKFTERGSVVLRGELLSRDEASLLIRFEVRDTGVGIEPAQLARLFRPFEQNDETRTRRHGGTGLGLTITRHIAELMGGEASAESLPGLGSRFWITVRLRPAQQPQSHGAPRLADLRCLVVDDLPEAREALASMLRALDLRVAMAAGGEEALRMAGAAAATGDPFALVLIDSAMPVWSGQETALRLREALDKPPAMVLVSARDERELVHSAREDGFGAILLKPVTPSLLLDCLMRLLRHATPSEPVARGAEDSEASLRERHCGARVLLAEDNPVNQEVAAELLQAAGLVVDIAGDGEQALRMARRADYDLILMDVQMPHMDGLEATRALRRDPRHAATPIVAMTANAFSDDRQQCLDAGMNDHLSKPVDPRVLHAAMLRWLPQRQPLSQAVREAAAQEEPASAELRIAALTRLDLEALYTQCAGKPELALRVLRQFLAHYRNTGEALLDHIQHGRLDEPRRKLHSLRGAAGAIGAVRLQELIVPVEGAIKRDEPLAEILPLAMRVQGELDALIEDLAQACGDSNEALA